MGAPIAREKLTERQIEIVEYIESLTKPLPETQHFYHYGSKPACDALVEQGGYAGKIKARYGSFSQGPQNAAGHGLYVADNIHSSSHYFTGSMIEVVLEKGTKVLDIRNPDVEDGLYKRNISLRELFDLPIDATVKYDDFHSWYVVKGSEGVHFKEFDPTHIPIKKFAEDIAARPMEPQTRAFLFNRARPYAAYFKATVASMRASDIEFLEFSIKDEAERARLLDAVVESFSPRQFDGVLEFLESHDKGYVAEKLLSENPRRLEMLQRLLTQYKPFRDHDFGDIRGGYKTVAEAKSALQLPHSNDLHARILQAIVDHPDTDWMNSKHTAAVSIFLENHKDTLGHVPDRFKINSQMNATEKIQKILFLASIESTSKIELERAVSELSATEKRLLKLRLGRTFEELIQVVGTVPAPRSAMKLGWVVAALDSPDYPNQTSQALTATYQKMMNTLYPKEDPFLLPSRKIVLFNDCKTAVTSAIQSLGRGGK